ncbi:MAG: sigma-70 family RNA polymerase sigma factor [Phycisphaera sp.]|nr:sigma-70 family RNA polymerase sigma factor [Phycisphaera sp.]
MEEDASSHEEGTTGFAEEAELVDALRRGEDSAYEHVVRENAGRMLAVATRILRDGDDAADAVQDAFLQAFKSIDRFEGNSKLSTWLHRIVVNAALMKLRTARRRNEKSIEDLLPRYYDDGHRINNGPSWDETAMDVLQRDETRMLIRTKIDELPDDYRTVLLLRDIEQLDTAQAAEVLGITSGAVKTRLHRARQALRTLLDPVIAQGVDL